jgi:hypothetical protein
MDAVDAVGVEVTGSRDEPPIPEITAISFGRAECCKKIGYRRKTPKTPQPGHQIGFRSDI